MLQCSWIKTRQYPDLPVSMVECAIVPQLSIEQEEHHLWAEIGHQERLQRSCTVEADQQLSISFFISNSLEHKKDAMSQV